MLVAMNLVRQWYLKIYKKHGQIDILVNNAGITRDSPLHKMSQENWQKVIDVNLNFCFQCNFFSHQQNERKSVWKNCPYIFS